MTDVFISYKRQDRTQAEQLAAALERHALSVWWDRELQAGDDFRSEIAAELDGAACVMVLWSARSVVPGNFVLSEASRAKKRNALLPVRIEDVEPPLGFDQMHYVDLLDWSGDDGAETFSDVLRQLSIRLHRGFKALRPEKRALLVSVDSYAAADEFALDGSPMAGAQALAQALSQAEGAAFKVEWLRDPDNVRLHRSMHALATRVATNDLLLLFFAGHARWSPEDGLCLCAADTQPDLIAKTGLPLTELATYIDRIPAEQVVVVLDCDFSVVAGADTAIDGALTDAFGRGKGKHLIATQTALRRQPQVHRGAFVRALAVGLETFAADSQRDNAITLDEWFEYAQRAAQAEGSSPPRKWAFDVAAATVEIARRAAPSTTAAAADAKSATTAPSTDVDPAFMDQVNSRLRNNRIVPLLGEGIYGSGPLSNFELIEEFSRRNRALLANKSLPMATVAEYCLEANGNDREAFLHELRDILAAHASRCEPRQTHRLVEALKKPWMVISTTYDWLLEERLAAAGHRFMVVAHVLRSANAKPNGIAVVRFGAEPHFETCLADELLPDEKLDCVIYKILGSPFLHDYAPTADQIDTVVATETDHATFLARLDNQSMSVPTCVAAVLQSRHLLYLGYGLDVWHYRLVSHVFSKTGSARAAKVPFAVRQASSAIEESFWQRLEVRLAPADAEGFASAVLDGIGT